MPLPSICTPFVAWHTVVASPDSRKPYIRVSNDGGRTFGRAHVVANRVSGTVYPRQVDCPVAFDPVTRTVYVSFLAYGLQGVKTDVAVARSTDMGRTFRAKKINVRCTDCDHPWTIARGGVVYTAYTQLKNHYLSISRDGGRTWHERLVDRSNVVGFAEGAVLDRAGNAYFAWGDCTTSSCNGPAAGEYRVSRTVAGTLRTIFTHVASAPGGPRCPYSPSCGFAFFGIQDDIGIDAAGTLYVVWQDMQPSGNTPWGAPTIVQLSRSTDDGRTWRYVGRADDKEANGCARAACYALFPRVEGGAPGQVDVMWMDDRLGQPINHENGWNVWLRRSRTGGSTWAGTSVRVSTYHPRLEESRPKGFLFPYGDYEDLKIAAGRAFLIWGEGVNYAGGPSNPGHVLYRSLAA